jgi:hypothetical protein
VGVDPFFMRMYDYPKFVELNTASAMAAKLGIDEQTAWKIVDPTAVAVVSGYPIALPQSLGEYVRANNFQRVRCWYTLKTGRVDLFMRDVPPGLVPSDNCPAN